MITLASDVQSPPNGWKLTVQETGLTLYSPYASSLRKKVNDHLRANGYPPMDRAQFEDAMCRESGHGEPWCTGAVGPVKPPTTMAAIKRFLKTAVALLKHRQIVSKEEQERRMEICRNCPKASINGLGCHTCIDDLREMEHQVGKMPEGNVLVCGACLCVCWVKTWLTNSLLDEAEKDDRPGYAPACWRDGP